MGYFSNSDEGLAYEEQHCSKCVHFERSCGCAVMLAHVLHAYSECGKKSAGEEILGLLIPRAADGLRNNRCAMFVSVETLTRKRRERAAEQQKLFAKGAT